MSWGEVGLKRENVKPAGSRSGLELGGRWGMVELVSDGQFTAKAAVLRGTILKEARVGILANLFCMRCRDSVTIINFKGEEEKGGLILKGL